MRAPAVISVLARSLLAGDPIVDAAHARAVKTLGRAWKWLRPLARRYVEQFAAGTRPRHRDVIRFLRQDRGFHRALSKHRHEISIAEWLSEPQRMRPVPAALPWHLP